MPVQVQDDGESGKACTPARTTRSRCARDSDVFTSGDIIDLSTPAPCRAHSRSGDIIDLLTPCQEASVEVRRSSTVGSYRLYVHCMHETCNLLARFVYAGMHMLACPDCLTPCMMPRRKATMLKHVSASTFSVPPSYN